MFGKKKKQAANERSAQIAPDVEFKAMGAATEEENQTNAIQARQSPGIAPASSAAPVTARTAAISADE